MYLHCLDVNLNFVYRQYGQAKASFTVHSTQTQTQTQKAFYFPNHMMMAQRNTCTYVNGLTNNNKWRLYFEFRLNNDNIEQKNKNINQKNNIFSIPVTRRVGCVNG